MTSIANGSTLCIENKTPEPCDRLRGGSHTLTAKAAQMCSGAIKSIGLSQEKGKPKVNTLKTEKQLAVVSALVEGVSIRSIERMTGVHREIGRAHV